MEQKKKDEIIQKTVDRFEAEKWGEGNSSIRVIVTVDLDSGIIKTEASKR